jgi:hypothetical protein
VIPENRESSEPVRPIACGRRSTPYGRSHGVERQFLPIRALARHDLAACFSLIAPSRGGDVMMQPDNARQEKRKTPRRRVIAIGKRTNGRWQVRTSLWRYVAATALSNQ